MKHLDGKDPQNIHFKWTNSLKPVISIKSGEKISVTVPDSSTWQIKREFSTKDLEKIDPDKYDGAVGPIYVEGSSAGDVLEIEIVEMRTADWGWSAIIPELGFLKGEFENRLVIWKIQKEALCISKDFLKDISIPVKPFLGVIGTAPKSGDYGMIPPQYFGGNMDNKKLGIGSRLYLPVNVDGALVSVSDPHASQGDGEVCGTAIETSAEVVLSIRVIKNQTLRFPRAFSKAVTPEDSTVAMGISSDLRDASRKALLNMIDELGHYGLRPEEAYILCSVAGDLSISEIVDEPNFVVSMSIPVSLLRQRDFIS